MPLPPPFITLGGVHLPPDMVWTDEYEFSPVRVKRDIALTGNQILQVASMTAGRSITIASRDSGAWLTRGQIDTLVAIRDQDLLQTIQMVLPDLRAFSVVFDLTQQPCFTATPLRPGKFTQATDYYKVTIKLLTV